MTTTKAVDVTTTKAVRYTQPLLGAADAAGHLIAVPGASVLIRQAGVACSVFGDNDRTPMTNPVPTGVPQGTAGVDVEGTLLVYFAPGRGYDGVSTIGNVSTTFAIPDISPDVADVQGLIPPGTFAGTKVPGTAMVAAAITDIGRRSPNAWNRYAGVANGAVPALSESGQSWVFSGQTPAVVSGKKRNPTPASGATYDSLVLTGPFGSMFVDFTLEASGTLGDQSVTLITNTDGGILLRDSLHFTISPSGGWGLSYVVGALSGGNPLIAIGSDPNFTTWAATSGRYRMGLAVDGNLIVVFPPNGAPVAFIHPTAAALAGPRCTWEMGWTAGQAEPRIVAESAAVYDATAVMAPPRDVFDLSRWQAARTPAMEINNLIAQKGTANEVEIGRSASIGAPAIRFGVGGPEWFGSGAAISTLAAVIIGQGSANQLYHDGNHLFFGTAIDTNLYRSAAATLKTDGAFVAGADITGGGDFKPGPTGVYRGRHGSGFILDHDTAGVPFLFRNNAGANTLLTITAGGDVQAKNSFKAGATGTFAAQHPSGFILDHDLNSAGFLFRNNAGANTLASLSAAGQFSCVMPAVGALKALDVGAADSGGAGFRTVRVAN